MSEVNIHNGDVVTFTALQWEEESPSPQWQQFSGKTSSPTMLLTPVAHIYEDGIELESVINEALVDAQVDGKLRDMSIEDFLSQRGWNLKYLKHIAQTVKKAGKPIGKNYRVLKQTYQFWRDENGKFQYVNLGY